MVEMNQSRDTQVEKYGGEDGYREEMRRRRKLVKAPGFASMEAEKRREAARRGGINSGINYRKNKNENDQTKESGQSS